jgi:hypothetical protein
MAFFVWLLCAAAATTAALITSKDGDHGDSDNGHLIAS